jgi:hypothetical protein
VSNQCCRSLSDCILQSERLQKEKAIEIEPYHIPARYRKFAEYIPTKQEVWSMVDSCGSSLYGLRNKALILTTYFTGFRSGTVRAILYRDVSPALENAKKGECIIVNCYTDEKSSKHGL